MPARTIMIATGAEYRRPCKNLSHFEGAGVYYDAKLSEKSICRDATFVEAQLCRGKDVIVLGGVNSAGQAAVFLAEESLRMLVFKGNRLKY